MRTFRFLAAARQELLDEIRYYGAAQEGLGVRFEKAVAAAVRRAVANPEHGTATSKRTRRMLVKGFPFGIVYRVTDETVLIVAVADSRRRPEYWAERIE